MIACVAVTGTAAVALAQPELPAVQSDAGGLSFFDHFVRSGGAITWFILIPLSMAMLALAIEQFFSVRRRKLVPPALQTQIHDLFATRRFAEVQAVTAKDPSMLAQAVHSGLQESGAGPEAIRRGIEESIETSTTKLMRKIEYLNIIGNVAPMIGLFGTVYGMILAFEKLRTSQGVPDAGKLAEGISVALVTTFWGLLIAIPALSVYAISRNRIDGAAAECQLWSDELFTGFNPVPGTTAAPKPAAATAPAAPPAPPERRPAAAPTASKP
jgi:biopolymer transport protein ExbB